MNDLKVESTHQYIRVKYCGNLWEAWVHQKMDVMYSFTAKKEVTQ